MAPKQQTKQNPAPAKKAPQLAAVPKKEKGEKKARKSLIERTLIGTGRALKGTERLSKRLAVWTAKLPDNVEIAEAAKLYASAHAAIGQAGGIVAKLPKDLSLPSSRGSGGGMTITKGMVVVLREKRAEAYAEIMSEEKKKTLTVANLVNEGKRIMLKTESGVRFVVSKGAVEAVEEPEV